MHGTPAREALSRLLENGVLRDLDVQLVQSLCRVYAVEPSPSLAVLLALTSRVSAEGHVCLDLSLPDWRQLAVENPAELLPPELATPKQAADLISESSVLIGTGEGITPFVVERNRLYLRRFWAYEKTVAERLLEMVADEPTEMPGLLALPENLNDGQRAAIRLACTRRLAILTGGPGTGKTYVAAQVIRCLGEMPGSRERPLRVKMAAPTGKAATRLTESLRHAEGVGGGVDCQDAVTIHKLLGARPGEVKRKHEAKNPIPADVVVVDECSMIPLPQMAHLLDAIGPETRLILLGDAHQLSSVEPGMVMADLCAAAALQENVAVLREGIRFLSDTPIARAAAAINEGDAETAWAEVEANMPHADSARLKSGEDKVFLQEIREGFAAYCSAGNPAEAFKSLDGFRILCALRCGPFGVENLNALVRRHVFGNPHDRFYQRRVVLITRNEPELNLSNGDIGIVWPDDKGDLKVFFENRGTPLSTLQLPEHEDGFAMTIHKAQGTGFHTACIVLPDEDNPLLTRELLYTAMTRAAENISLWCTEPVFQKAVQTPTLRIGGLLPRLDTA